MFFVFRWRRSLLWCTYTQTSSRDTESKLREVGRLLEIPSEKELFEIDSEYVHIDFQQGNELFERNMEILCRILSRFRGDNHPATGEAGTRARTVCEWSPPEHVRPL